ncbi:serine hydrolase domain-containing protein [Nonomuraea polychroma]|uniref:serine hydrolase domain-containing protein n=1 Tax=Nonomuraea polychroma TaxID=46176 RepID=UPI003D91CE64
MRSQPALLPRSTPAVSGVSSRSITALLDRLEAQSIELHSIMVVRHGHVVAEGWWAPYSAGRPHLLYSLTKSFTSVAVGLAIADGLLSLDDRVVDVLPDHVPADISEQGRRITVHHLLSMTAGHSTDSLAEAWQLESGDLVKGFLRVPFSEPEGTRHTYDNATTFVLARMVERVTGRGLPVPRAAPHDRGRRRFRRVAAARRRLGRPPARPARMGGARDQTAHRDPATRGRLA